MIIHNVLNLQVIILIIAFFFSFSLSAQTIFERTYGGIDSDWGNSVQQTSDNGYIITGSTNSFGYGDYDVYLIKTDEYGDTLWTCTYGGINRDEGHSVQQTLDGGFVIVGVTYSFGFGLSDVYLIKTDPNGDTLWTSIYGGVGYDYGYSVQQTSDQGYIVAGKTSYGVYIIKTDIFGDTLWTRTYGKAYDFGYSVKQTSDGGYIIAGCKGFDNVYLIKMDANGDSLWTRTYGGNKGDAGHSVQQTSDGGYIIAGLTRSFGKDHHNVYLIKTDSNGDTLWTRTYLSAERIGVYPGTPYSEGHSVQQTSDNGYIIAGESGFEWPGGFDYLISYLLKTDSSGNIQWRRTYSGTAALSVQQTSDGGYVAVGSGSGDVYLIKTDSLGIIPGDIPSLASLHVSPNPTKAGRITVTINFDAGAGQIDNSVSPLVVFNPAYDTTKFPIQQTSFQGSTWKGTARITDNMHNGMATILVEGVQNTIGIIMKPLNNAGSFIIDTVAPIAFHLLSPEDSSWTNEGFPILSWYPSADTTSGLWSYTLFLNSQLNMENIAPFQTAVAPALELEDGDYKWWVVANDRAGNIRKCHKERLLRVDKTPPTSAITNPEPGDEVSGTIIIEGTATDNAGIGVDSIMVSTNNGESWQGTISTSEDFSTWEYRWNVSRDGPIAILTKAIDKLGNKETSHGITVTDLLEIAQNKIPTNFALLQNYPNPFNSETEIRFQLPKAGQIVLRIYNNLGQEVRRLVDSPEEAGYHSVGWDGIDENGNFVPSGVYLYQLQVGSFSQVKKMILIR